MKRLYELSMEISQATELPNLLEKVLAATIELHSADFGCVQLYDKETQTLRIVAQRGFPDWFLEQFGVVPVRDDTTCGIAFLSRKRAIFEDVEIDPPCAPVLATCRKLGCHAIQNTPMATAAGELLGVLSTQSRERRRFSDQELRLTDMYARQAADAIASFLYAKALTVSEKRFRAYVTATSDVVYVMSPDWREMQRLSGARFLSDTTGPNPNWLREYIPPESQSEVLEAIERAVKTRNIFEFEHRVVRQDGTLGWTLSRAVPLLNERGEIEEWIGAASDVTALKQADELRAALAERDALLKEVHHRVKNNLQVISSLLEMQANRVDDPLAFAQLEEACNRVASIASIHELLYRRGSFAEIDMAPYIRELARRLVSFYGVEGQVRVDIVGENVTLDLETAVPCGLLLNELLSNACKHAFPEGKPGVVTVSFKQQDDDITLEVADTGIGMPADVPLQNSNSLGLKLVRTLVEQLGGTVETHAGAGTGVRIRFPYLAPAGKDAKESASPFLAG